MGVASSIRGLISPEEILAMKEEAYECNDARLLCMARSLEMVQGDPYATCALLLTAFRMLAKDHRGLMEKLVKAMQVMPPSHVYIPKEK